MCVTDIIRYIVYKKIKEGKGSELLESSCGQILTTGPSPTQKWDPHLVAFKEIWLTYLYYPIYDHL